MDASLAGGLTGGFEWGGLAGVFIGLVLGTVAIVIARIRSNRRGAPPATAPVRKWRKLLPDFSALIPTTTQRKTYLGSRGHQRRHLRGDCLSGMVVVHAA